MKTLLTAFIVSIATQSAFALSANDSWESILDSQNIQTEAATVAFKAGDATAFVSVLRVCALNEDEFMTVDPQDLIRVYREGNTTHHEIIGTARLVGSNKYISVEKDASSSSPGYTEFVREISRRQVVDVMYKPVGASSSAVKLFSKDYYIPDCSN